MAQGKKVADLRQIYVNAQTSDLKSGVLTKLARSHRVHPDEVALMYPDELIRHHWLITP